MADSGEREVEQLMRVVEGEGPSPEFVGALRERIAAETQSRGGDHRNGIVVDIDLRPSEPEPLPLGRIVLAVAAALAVVVGFVALFSDNGEEGIDSISPPDSTTISEGDPTEMEAPEADALFDPAAPLLLGDGVRFGPGVHRVDTLGTSFSFQTEVELETHENGQAHVVFADPVSVGGDDRELVFFRPAAFSDPSQPKSAGDGFGEGWPADDFDGWLDGLIDDVAVTDRTNTTLGGLPAARVDLAIARECSTQTDAYCMVLGSTGVYERELRAGGVYRIWVVDQNGEQPLVVMMVVSREEDLAWFDTAEEILTTLAFDKVAPSPVLASQPGFVDLEFLGGVRLELTDGLYAISDPGTYGRVVLQEWSANTAFLTTPLDLEGNPVLTSDALESLLRATDAEVSEIEAVEIDALPARVFDLADPRQTPVLAVPEGAEWQIPQQARIWLIEHPERGLLMITSEPTDRADVVFPLNLEQSEAIIASLEFVDDE